MNGRRNQNFTGTPIFKVLMVPCFAALAFLAVLVGIQAGNILYRLDSNIVENIDPESFKNTIRASLPIIETVYNSGKSSASLTGEVKELFSKIFEFELDSPMTILNVQSSLFMSYYNHYYKNQTALDKQQDLALQQENGSSGQGGGAGNNANQGSAAQGRTGSQTGQSDQDGAAGNGTGQNSQGAAQNGTGSGTGGSSDNAGTGDQNGTPTGGDGTASGTAGGGTASPGPADLQPISSITYEAEDEDENENSDTVALDRIVVQNYTKHKIDIARLLKEPLNIKNARKGPQVLVYHTHSTESYVLRTADIGKKNTASFNTNPKYSVVRVGEELSRYLRKYGISTLHNGTVHDKNRNAAYGVAINTLKSYKKSYPSIDVFIDIHRDGVDASKPKLRIVRNINGKNAAQIMFVVGTDDMLPHPGWEENLKFVLKIQQKLNEKYPGLARPVRIVSKRYNQQVSNQAVLIEVGGDGNLLDECLQSAKYLSWAINSVMKGK